MLNEGVKNLPSSAMTVAVSAVLMILRYGIHSASSTPYFVAELLVGERYLYRGRQVLSGSHVQLI
jgi:hypothetical protein